mmetsp:Transcript_14237/g.41775  ORF Transcript_14237/g.41775 Transcript_14237/m.41775 type:complete len:729 (-) Transcript_14237:38-2224(-)
MQSDETNNDCKIIDTITRIQPREGEEVNMTASTPTTSADVKAQPPDGEETGRATSVPVTAVDKAVAAKKDVAQKAMEATVKAAEDARRGAEETADRLKAAFKKRTESGSEDGLSRPKAFFGNNSGWRNDQDDSLDSPKQRTLNIFSGKKEGESGSRKTASDVAEKTREMFVAPVKVGAKAVRHIEKKFTQSKDVKESLDGVHSDSGVPSEGAAAISGAGASVQPESNSVTQMPTTSDEIDPESKAEQYTHLSKNTLVVGPLLEFMVRDSSILCAASILAILLTCRSTLTIMESGVVPLKTALSWTLLGFLSGFHWTFLSSQIGSAVSSLHHDSAGRTSPFAKRPSTAADDDPHKFFNRSVCKMTSIRHINYVMKPEKKKQPIPSVSAGFRTCLDDHEGRQIFPWEASVSNCSENEGLLKRLLFFGDLRVKKKGSEWSGGSMTAAESNMSKEEVAGKNLDVDRNVQPVGAVRMRNKSQVDTLAGEFVVDPLCRLRGMDIFQTDCPSEKLYEYRMLTRMGMRKVPTLLVNIMAPWANILVYFQLPGWVKRFQDIKELEEDAEDTKAFKRFLTAAEDYRKPRLKIFPSLVDGPLPIRMLAPPKKEITVKCETVPTTWHFLDETVNNDGSVNAALVEVDLDLLESKTVRKMASVVRSQTARITVDCALVISKPIDSQNDEPSALLGMWRLDKVDMDGCAVLPPKTESEIMHEATSIMNTVQKEPVSIAVAAG